MSQFHLFTRPAYADYVPLVKAALGTGSQGPRKPKKLRKKERNRPGKSR
jgi:hypothetical protein